MKRPKSEYIYLIRQHPLDPIIDGKRWWNTSLLFKVGWSVSPRSRLESFQTGNPFKLSIIGQWIGGEKDETYIKNILKSRNIRNEWFKLCPQELDSIKGFCQVIEIRNKSMIGEEVNLRDQLLIEVVLDEYENWFHYHESNCTKSCSTPVAVEGLAHTRWEGYDRQRHGSAVPQ